MKQKKRSPRHKKPSAELAPPREPPPIAQGPSGVYVKLPLPRELLEAVEEHTTNALRLRDLLSRADASVLELAEVCRDAARALERDVGRVRAALKKRR